jgi:hypothetical protein
MSLKFPFKFKYGSHDYTFTARLRVDEDMVDVEWVDSLGEYCSVPYTLCSAQSAVADGSWRVLPKYKADPLIELRQSEYDNLIEEINLLQELLAEALTTQTQGQFKPVKGMTFEDWVQAEREEWTFEVRCGAYTKVDKLDPRDRKWKVATKFGWNAIDGSFDPDYDEHDYDIIKRVA